MFYITDPSSLVRAIASEDESRAVVETFLDELLVAHAGFAHRDTDGAIILHEERNDREFFAVGKVFMIQDQSAEPFCIVLALANHGAFSSGRVLFGLQDGKLPEGIGDFKKLEKALIARPRVTASSIRWTHGFQCCGDGWAREVDHG